MRITGKTVLVNVAVLGITFAVAFFASTPQSIEGAAVYVYGGTSTGCVTAAAPWGCGGPPGGRCASLTATRCTLANNDLVCLDEWSVCTGCPNVNHWCR